MKKVITAICLVFLCLAICGSQMFPPHLKNPIVTQKVIKPYSQQWETVYIGKNSYQTLRMSPFERYIAIVGTNDCNELEEYKFLVSLEDFDSVYIGSPWTREIRCSFLMAK